MNKGKKVGYKRVSTVDQNPEAQLRGLDVDKIFVDKASGKDIKRPSLERLLDYVREDDVVFVDSLDRLARNLYDLRRLVNYFNQKNVEIRFVRENLIFNGKDSPMSMLLLSVMGAFAEFERSLIKERQKEGIELAKKRGAYKGRKKVFSKEQTCIIKKKVELGFKIAEIAREYKVSRKTIYEYLKGKI